MWVSETTEAETRDRETTYTIGVKARAFRKDGSLRVIPPGFGATGDAQLPHGREGLLLTRMAERLSGNSPQIHIGKGQNHIRMSALGTNNVAGAAVLDANGNVIGRRFNGAYTGADLEWLDIGHGVLEYFHLSPGHPQQFEVRIDGLAGNLVASPRGWDLQDDSGTPVLWAGRGYLFKPNDPLSLTVPVPTTVRTQGGKSIYTYTLPAPLPGKTDWRDWTLEPSWESQPGAADGDDTLLISNASADLNFGGNLQIQCGLLTAIRRSLLRFDLSSLVGTVVSGSLVLYNIDHGSTTASGTAQLNRILSANTSWIAGTVDGLTQEGSACWNYRVYNAATPTNWSGSAGLGTSGTDFSATVMGQGSWSDGVAEFITFTLLAAELSAMQSNNAGMRLSSTDETTDGKNVLFASSNYATAEQRPKLTVVTTVEQARGLFRPWRRGL